MRALIVVCALLLLSVECCEAAPRFVARPYHGPRYVPRYRPPVRSKPPTTTRPRSSSNRSGASWWPWFWMANNNNRNAGAAAGPAAADGDEPNWWAIVGAWSVLGAGAGLIAWRLAPAKTTEDAQ